tara:strand:+ start:9542 stop:10306 length:765 start_codon:yes stop_codon:yes gene_type:complete
MNELCIGGGGIDGLSFIGALEYIHQNKLLDLKTFYGCSIGSLIGILYISGISPRDILSIVINLDISQLIKYDFSNIKTNKSLLDNKILMELIDNLDEYKDITIEQFSDKYKVDINIYATNINRSEYTNFNKKTFPEIRIKDAIKASMSVPFIFPPVKIRDDYYIDGCVKSILGIPPREICILGYTIILKNISHSYMSSVIKSGIKNEYPNSLYIIECNCDNGSQDILNAANKVTPKYILDLYKGGIKCAREQLE